MGRKGSYHFGHLRCYNFRNYQPWVEETLKRDNYQCTKCASKNSIIAHHIDESRKNGLKYANNHLDNLITLCRRCHAEVHGQQPTNPNTNLIFWLRSQGATYKAIANYFKLSHQRIQQIIKK
jgi:5-methylcytosine-specific restriction endonuclease McrA